jgi:hypothetical protein
LAVYAILRFAADPIDSWIHGLRSVLRPHSPAVSLDQFLMSNLLAFSFLPAFFASFLINIRLRHRVACFVWIVPVSILAYNFLFRSATIYPTIPLESELRPALHHWFGGGFNINSRESYMHDFYRVYSQFRVTAPAYAGLAYSGGAWLAIKIRIPRLENFLQKW